jgi:hypothetical protein
MTVPMMANTGIFQSFSPVSQPILPSKRSRMSTLEVPIFNPDDMAFSEPLMIDMNSEFNQMLSPSSSPADLLMYGPSPFMFNDTSSAMFDSSQAPTNPFLELGFSSEFGLESLSRTISAN